jgi:ATP-binding cassette subfamily C protein LapB
MAQAASRRWLRDLFVPLVGPLREVAVFSLAINVLALAVPIFVLQVYDRVVFHAGMSTLQGLVAGMALALVFDFVLRQARARILQTVALRVDVALGRRLFETLTGLPLRQLERIGAAEWATCFRDIDVVRNALSGSSALLLCEAPFVVVAATLIFVLASPIAWILLLVVPLMALLAWRSATVMLASGRKERASLRGRDALLGELIAARTTIKALACTPIVRDRWEAAHADAVAAAAVRGGRSDAYANLGTTLILTTTVALSAAGALAILDQRMTIGALVATNMLSGRLLGPLNQLVGGWRSFVTVRLSLQRLGAMFARAEPAAALRGVAMARPEGEIAIEDVSFTYLDGARASIDHVTLRLPARGLHAVTGANGSGKSTLLKLICGLYRPTGGRVMIAGADAAQYGDGELSLWIGYLPQDSALLAGSIRDNIAMRRPASDDREIVAAARLADLDRAVAEMADGYASEVGEAGRRLSAGQRQRVALARALLGDPAILLLDEPSTALDGEASGRLGETLRTLARTRPVVIVTHSLTLLAMADSITHLHAGAVVRSGPGGEVLPTLLAPVVRDGPRPAPFTPRHDHGLPHPELPHMGAATGLGGRAAAQ